METGEIQLTTGDEFAVVDVTGQVQRWLADRVDGGDGLCTVVAPHATAGLALMETGSGSEADLQQLHERLLPRDGNYRHQHGSRGHGGDHVLPALVAPTVTLPVVNGSLDLGTWQSLVLVDPNTDNRERRLRLAFLPG